MAKFGAVHLSPLFDLIDFGWVNPNTIKVPSLDRLAAIRFASYWFINAYQTGIAIFNLKFTLFP